MPGASIYSALKAALLSLAKNLSAELLPSKIRVNAISPGLVGTPLHTSAKLGITDDELRQMGEGIIGQIPVGGFGEASKVARAAVFLHQTILHLSWDPNLLLTARCPLYNLT